ncbi:hypothetical protein ABT256_22940 [Amycolatopsis japonica]
MAGHHSTITAPAVKTAIMTATFHIVVRVGPGAQERLLDPVLA